MHASTQERFKHCIPPQPTIDIFKPPFPRRRRTESSSVPAPPAVSEVAEMNGSNCRINITFRFYRPDFRPESIPRCKCGVPCILRPDMKNRIDRQAASKYGKCRSTASVGSSSGMKTEGQRDETATTEGEKHIMKYWWTCYSGAQNEGKGCGMWKVMDIYKEGRGPIIDRVG